MTPLERIEIANVRIKVAVSLTKSANLLRMLRIDPTVDQSLVVLELIELQRDILQSMRELRPE